MLGPVRNYENHVREGLSGRTSWYNLMCVSNSSMVVDSITGETTRKCGRNPTLMNFTKSFLDRS